MEIFTNSIMPAYFVCKADNSNDYLIYKDQESMDKDEPIAIYDSMEQALTFLEGVRWCVFDMIQERN